MNWTDDASDSNQQFLMYLQSRRLRRHFTITFETSIPRIDRDAPWSIAATATNYKSKQSLQSSPIFVSHECLLIPVALGLWWYWTKRTARKVYRTLLRIAPSCSEEEEDAVASSFSPRNEDDGLFADAFQSWNDVESSCQSNLNDNNKNNSNSSSSVRFVRWIKSSSQSSASRKEYRVRTMTLQNLRKQSSIIRSQLSSQTDDPERQTQQELIVITSPSTTQNNNFNSYPYPSSWECIPDTTHRHVTSWMNMAASTSSTTILPSVLYNRMEDICFIEPSETAVAKTTSTPTVNNHCKPHPSTI